MNYFTAIWSITLREINDTDTGEVINMDSGKIKIDLNLLAVINNDVFIKGTRNLGASNYKQTISYLRQFMMDDKNRLLVDHIFDSTEEKNNLSYLNKRVSSLLEMSNEIDDLKFPLRIIQHSNQNDRKAAIEGIINEGAKPFVSRLKKLLKSSEQPPSSVLMPGGWLDKSGESGCAIVYEFKKDQNGDCLFLVYNSGAGLQYHENITSADKERYRTVKAYKIPGKVSEADLNFFVSELIKPVTLPSVQTGSSYNFNAKVLYEEVFRQISHLKGEEIPLEQAELGHAMEELASVAQRGGTFAEKALQELIKINIKDKNKAKALIFSYKLYSIEEFIEQNKNSMDIKKTSQLELASRNLSKMLINHNKKNLLPKDAQERATKVLEEAKALLEKSQLEYSQSQSLDSLIDLGNQAVSPENIDLNKTPTISVVSSKEKIIPKPFNLEKVKILTDLTSAQTLDLEKLKLFKSEIENLGTKELYKDAEQALFDYFTQVPLTKNYFSSVTKPAHAIEYVDLTNFLVSKYIEMVKKTNNGSFKSNPKTTAVMLNMAQSLDLLYQNNSVKIVGNSGIDSLYNKSDIGLNHFKKTRVNNVYLSTEIPEVDERTKQIISDQREASRIDLDAFINYINTKPIFKTFLVGLFDKPPYPDIFDPETKQNMISNHYNSVFRNASSNGMNDIKATVAFLSYFNDRNCEQYKDELDKLTLYKKMKVTCDRMTSYSSGSYSFGFPVNTSSEMMFNGKMVQYTDYNNRIDKFYSDSFDAGTNRQLIIDSGLNSYFTEINDLKNRLPLYRDEASAKEEHKTKYKDNEIFFYPEGEETVETQVQSEHGRLHQKLRHLRTAPDLQVMTTIDYFKDKLHLFANKVSGEEKGNREEKDNILKNDIQQYLRRNLFQPGLLFKEFQRNPESYETIQDNFLNKAILYFTKNGKINDETLFFYDLQQDINQYALKSPAFSNEEKKSIFSDLSNTYRELSKVNQGELNQSERYELLKVKLKIQLALVEYLKDVMPYIKPDAKKEHYKKLFEAYMEFSASSREVILNFAEKTQELKQLKYQCIEILKEDDNIKKEIFNWNIDYIKNNHLASEKEWEEISPEIPKNVSGNFPYFYVKNNSGEELVAIDMLEGLVLIKGNYFCYPPDVLVSSPIYKAVCGDEYPRMAVTIMNKTGNLGSLSKENLKTYSALGSDKIPGRFVETGKGSTVPYVYQQFVKFRNESRFCEKRILTDNNSALSLMVKAQNNLSLNLSLKLPESFYSRETNCWVACDDHPKGAVYIEKQNGQYVVDLESSNNTALIKELDESKRETGFILSTNYQDSKVESIINVFKGFDAPEFTEILFKSANNNQVEEVKVKFPRYNLELKGKFDAKTSKWELYQENNPNLILVDDHNIQIKPNINIDNSLVFEDKITKQRFLYTPVQDYYVNSGEEFNESASETVYYKPHLDTINLSKRMLQRKEFWSVPAGATTYSGSEGVRIFSIDGEKQELKTATSEDKLHLAYLGLINLQPEEALNSIRSIIISGGLKGTLQELELIEKIFNRTPLDSTGVNQSLRIDSPEFMAVRTHILYLISDLQFKKKTFGVPDSVKIKGNTPDNFIYKKQVENLEAFERNIPSLMHEHLNKSLNLYSATPKEMRLPKALEYKMIPRLENGYTLGLFSTGPMSKAQVESLTEYLTDPPILIQCKSSSRVNQKPQYWLIGKDIYGKNQVTNIKDVDLMNTLPFSADPEKLNSVYISEEKNREIFLEIEAKKAHIHQSKTVPIQARYEHLKNWYNTRELAKTKNKTDEKVSDRIKKLESKTTRIKTTDTYQKKVETKTLQMPLINVVQRAKVNPEKSPDYIPFNMSESDFYPNMYSESAKNHMIKSTMIKIEDINPQMTDEQFLERIIPIIELVKSTDSRRGPEREKLKGFLEDTLKANCKIRPEIQKSLIRNWAPSLLTALQNRQVFRDVTLENERKKTYQEFEWISYKDSTYKYVNKTIVANPNRHEEFVKSFFAKAYQISATKSYPIQIKDYQYYLKPDFDISSKQFKVKKYTPQPINIEESTAYEKLTYDDFVIDSGLILFCVEMIQINNDTEQAVDKLKIQLDLEIRQSVLKQDVELLQAELKYKKSPELQSQLESKLQAYQIDQKSIDLIKTQLENNIKKDITEEILIERAELIQKFRSMTKEGRYQDTAEIKRQYDEKIGAIRNNEGDKIFKTTQAILNEKSKRDDAKNTCVNYISILEPKITALDKSVLILANKGPNDPEAQQKYRRALQAIKRKPLTMGDLNRLFVLADFNEYKKVTGLDDEKEIQSLHNQMAEYINLNILKQQYTRIQSILDKTEDAYFNDHEKTNEIIQLGRTIATDNMLSPTGHADIQFFQKEENILITPLQNFYLDKLLNKDEITGEYRNEVIQLIMGGGKSKVLGPLSMLKKADGTNLAIFQVKNSLLETNYADMNATSRRLFNQEAVLFKFDRNSPCSSKDLKVLYNLFHKTSIDKGYVVTSGTCLQSLELKYLETLGDVPSSTNPKNAECIEWKKKIKWFERSLTLFKTKGDRIIDEVHDELDPNKELNYTLGDAIPPTKEDIKLIVEVFYFLREVSIGKEELGLEKEIKAIDLIQNNKFITDPNSQMAKIMDKIASDLVNNLNTPNTNPLAKIITKLVLKTDSEKLSLKEYLLNKNPDILPLLKSKLTQRELTEIAFVKSEVSKFLPSTLLKNYNENYGPSRVEGLNQIKKRLAIPYTDLNTPNERSRFGEFTESMNYTIQMNLIEPVSTELVTELVKEYIEKAQTEQVDSLNAKFDTTSASIEYNVKFGKVAKPTLEQIKNYLFDKDEKQIGDSKIISSLFFAGKPSSEELDRILLDAEKEQSETLNKTNKLIKTADTKASKKFDETYRLKSEPTIIELKQISELNKAHFDCLVSILKESEDFKKVILSDYVLKQVENNPVVLTSNSQDSGAMTRTTQAMSGTPHNFKSYHRNIHFDEAQGLGTDGETISLLKNKNTPVIDSSAYESATGLLNEYLEDDKVDERVRKNTRAIIDIGALFKKEKSNFSIATQIGQYCKDNPTKFSSKIKYILYFENQGDVLHAWDITKQQKIKLSSSDEKEISKALEGCKPEERFTFYDQARITGTDIVQAPEANAIATFSEKTTKSKFLQGVKRMRQFHNKQTVSVVKADYLKPRLPKDNDIDEVISFVNQVQVDKALQLHFKSTGHIFKNALRDDFLNIIRDQENDPIKKHKLLDTFKSIFNKNYQPNHFLNHGAVETDQDAILYFPIMAEKYYDQWEQLLEEAGRAPTDQEKITMKNILEDLGKKAIDDCEKIFKSKPIERVGAEMAQDDNLGNEVENELENELEIQIEKELELEKEIITYEKDKSKFLAQSYVLDDNVNALSKNQLLFHAKDVISQVPFDDNIFMTAHQRQTVAGNFSNYYDQYIKPYDVVMMVAQKNKPETLQCVVLTKEEAQEHIDRNQIYRNKDVWFVSCSDTLLHGQKPAWLKPKNEDLEPKPEDLFKYNRILEQVRYINGDLNAILQQKNGITWLNENAQTKLDFIINTILKRFPEANKYYGNLKSRLDVTSKIFNYMQTHPFENYTVDDYNWNIISKGFIETADAESKAKINIFAQALHEINTLYENNYQDIKLSKLQIEKTYDQQIAYRLNQHKESFLDKRTKVIEALSKNQSIEFVQTDSYKDIDLNFLVKNQTLFEIALNNNASHLTENLFAKNKIKWTDKNGDSPSKTNAELALLHANKIQNKEKNIHDVLVEIVGGKQKNTDKLSNLIVSKNSEVNLLMLGVKHNNLAVLNMIQDEYLSSFNEKDLKVILEAAQQQVTKNTLPEINKLIQTHGKDGDLIEKHKRLKTVVFDKINTWIESGYNEKIKLDFSKRPFSVATVDFDNFTQEDKDFVKTVVDKLVENPNHAIFDYFNKKQVFDQPNMLDKTKVLTDVITHSSQLADTDLNKIITILVSKQAEVKSAFALALESQKSTTVLGHLKSQKGVDIYFDPDKDEANKQFLLLRNYGTDSTEEMVRKIKVYQEIGADFNTKLDHTGNAVIHNLCLLEKNQDKLKSIISALSNSLTLDLNAKNQQDETALHIAIRSNNPAMVKFLLEQKDDKKQDKIKIDSQNAQNKTAMDLVADLLQADETFSPEIVRMITDSYKRAHQNDYLKDIPLESMLSEEIWDYLNKILSKKEDGFKDSTVINKIIHANSRNETEFNIHKSEFYKRLNSENKDKLLSNYVNYIGFYDAVQFDKDLLGKEFKIVDFNAPKLAQIKKETIDTFPNKWSRNDVVAIQVLHEIRNNTGQFKNATDLIRAQFIIAELDKKTDTLEEFYNAKKELNVLIQKMNELTEPDDILTQKEIINFQTSIKLNNHKFIPNYKASETDRTTQPKSQEGSAEGAVSAQEKDWSQIAHGYLADVIPSGQYLNNYQNIPFEGFIQGSVATQEEFDKLKAETKKYLNLIFQDSVRDKEIVIGVLDKINFKTKLEENAQQSPASESREENIRTPQGIADELFEKISAIPNGFDLANKEIIVDMLHEETKQKQLFLSVKSNLRNKVQVSSVKSMILGLSWDPDFEKKIIAKREAEALRIQSEAKNTVLNSSKQGQQTQKSETPLKQINQTKNIKQTKQYEKNYTLIAKEIFNFAIPFTNNYEKSFNPALKIKLKEHVKTQEDFNEITEELNFIFNKQLIDQPGKIKNATEMLNSIKITDLGIKVLDVPKPEEAKPEGKPVEILTQPKIIVAKTEEVKTEIKLEVKPLEPLASQLNQVQTLLAQIESYVPDKLEELKVLNSKMYQEQERLKKLNSPEAKNDLEKLKNARTIIAPFIRYKELLDTEQGVSDSCERIPENFINDLSTRVTKELDKIKENDLNFAKEYIANFKNLNNTINRAIPELKAILTKNNSQVDIKLYENYMLELESLAAKAKVFQKIINNKNYDFERYKIETGELAGLKSYEYLYKLTSPAFQRIMRIKDLTSEIYDLSDKAVKTPDLNSYPETAKFLKGFKENINNLKNKSAQHSADANLKEVDFSYNAIVVKIKLTENDTILSLEDVLEFRAAYEAMIQKGKSPVIDELVYDKLDSSVKGLLNGKQTWTEWLLTSAKAVKSSSIGLNDTETEENEKNKKHNELCKNLDVFVKELNKKMLVSDAENKKQAWESCYKKQLNAVTELADNQANLDKLQNKSIYANFVSVLSEAEKFYDENKTNPLFSEAEKINLTSKIADLSVKRKNKLQSLQDDIKQKITAKPLDIQASKIGFEKTLEELRSPDLIYSNLENSTKEILIKEVETKIQDLSNLLTSGTQSPQGTAETAQALDELASNIIMSYLTTGNTLSFKELIAKESINQIHDGKINQLIADQLPTYIKDDEMLKKANESLFTVKTDSNIVTSTAVMKSENLPQWNEALHCKTTGWHNNCGLNCLTHFIYAKLEKNDLQKLYSNDAEYDKLLTTFQEYYALPNKPTWDDIKAMLSKLEAPHDREAILAPVLRQHLGKLISENAKEIWKKDASVALWDHFKDTPATDVGIPIYTVNQTIFAELKKEYEQGLPNLEVDKKLITNLERGVAIDLINEQNQQTKNTSKLLDVNNEETIKLFVYNYRVLNWQDKIGDKAKADWLKKGGGCEKFANHMANLNTSEMISAGQLGFLANKLKINTQIFRPDGMGRFLINFNDNAATQLPDWVMKVSHSGAHWEYEEPSQNVQAAAEHNKFYATNMPSKFHTFGQRPSNLMSQLEEIKQYVLSNLPVEKPTIKPVKIEPDKLVTPTQNQTTLPPVKNSTPSDSGQPIAPIQKSSIPIPQQQSTTPPVQTSQPLSSGGNSGPVQPSTVTTPSQGTPEQQKTTQQQSATTAKATQTTPPVQTPQQPTITQPVVVQGLGIVVPPQQPVSQKMTSPSQAFLPGFSSQSGAQQQFVSASVSSEPKTMEEIVEDLYKQIIKMPNGFSDSNKATILNLLHQSCSTKQDFLTLKSKFRNYVGEQSISNVSAAKSMILGMQFNQSTLNPNAEIKKPSLK